MTWIGLVPVRLRHAAPGRCHDCIVTITIKMASRIQRLYAQMPEPKYVISMGCCTLRRSYWEHGYHVLKVLIKLFRRRVYSGCPPRPEALLEAF